MVLNANHLHNTNTAIVRLKCHPGILIFIKIHTLNCFVRFAKVNSVNTIMLKFVNKDSNVILKTLLIIEMYSAFKIITLIILRRQEYNYT